MSQQDNFQQNEHAMENIDLITRLLCTREADLQRTNHKKRKGPSSKFTEQEEVYLTDAILRHGMQSWKEIAQYIAQQTGQLQRSPEQVSQHWRRVSNPILKKNSFTKAEIDMLKHLYIEYGPQWKEIGALMHRTDVSVRYQVQQLIQKGLM